MGGRPNERREMGGSRWNLLLDECGKEPVLKEKKKTQEREELIEETRLLVSEEGWGKAHSTGECEVWPWAGEGQLFPPWEMRDGKRRKTLTRL